MYPIIPRKLKTINSNYCSRDTLHLSKTSISSNIPSIYLSPPIFSVIVFGLPYVFTAFVYDDHSVCVYSDEKKANSHVAWIDSHAK